MEYTSFSSCYKYFSMEISPAGWRGIIVMGFNSLSYATVVDCYGTMGLGRNHKFAYFQ